MHPQAPDPIGREPMDKILTQIEELQNQIAELPNVDSRSPDEIIGYDERGLPS
jgi:hypothetical protein